MIIVVIAFFVMVGGYFWYKARTLESRKLMGSGGMTAQPTPPMTDEQKQQLANGVSKATTAKTFTVIGGSFFFVPNKITVNKGDTVTIAYTNSGGFHDFYLDEFGVKVGPIQTGKTVNATFVADKAGSFEYYCSIGQHRKLGQRGTLIVQ